MASALYLFVVALAASLAIGTGPFAVSGRLVQPQRRGGVMLRGLAASDVSNVLFTSQHYILTRPPQVGLGCRRQEAGRGAAVWPARGVVRRR